MIGPVAVIEITGLPAILALLAPVVLLVVVIVRLRRAPRPDAGREVPRAPDRILSGETAAPPAPAAEPPEPVDWALRIRSAEAANDHATLAGLYLSYARAELADGRGETAAEQLRACVRAANKSRNRAVEAEARLELADLARAADDLTTACEHWQIARALFHDLSQEARRSETEQLMQKHGCPTDWVLNDF